MKVFFSFFLLFSSGGLLFSQSIIPLQSGRETSIRGLSVLNDSVAWISGSNGWTALTSDNGKNWKWQQIKGYEKFDFRDIESFSENKAILVSAGSPAVIIITEDGGNTWKEVYRNQSPDIFLDGMDFWDDERGIIYGDPINGKMVLLKTSDGGDSWKEISDNLNIRLVEGEASFAASGTNIRCRSKGKTWIATGGKQSRIFYSSDYGENWLDYPCPILQGKNSTGPFSIAFVNKRTGIAAGGDYLRDTLRENNLLLTKNGGKTWHKPTVSTFGYRSAVEYITSKMVVAAGPTGTDLSLNGGKSWRNLSGEGYHTVRRSKSGSWVLLTGSGGRIAELQI